MTRNDIIDGLKRLTETEENLLESRMEVCNVRIHREDGSTEEASSIRGPRGALRAMRADETIDRIQYRYNGEWLTVC